MPLTQEKSAGYGGQIAILAAAIEEQLSGASEDMNKRCTYANEKLSLASKALEEGDEDSTWLHLHGAAMFCRTSGIQPVTAKDILVNADRLLESA